MRISEQKCGGVNTVVSGKYSVVVVGGAGENDDELAMEDTNSLEADDAVALAILDSD